MSADNGYTVARCEDTGKIGIFYWSGDGEVPCIEERAVVKERITGENPHDPGEQITVHLERHVYTDVMEAIVTAHLLDHEEWTEYGVSVEKELLELSKKALLNLGL